MPLILQVSETDDQLCWFYKRFNLHNKSHFERQIDACEWENKGKTHELNFPGENR
jgi:hypothetical protein